MPLKWWGPGIHNFADGVGWAPSLQAKAKLISCNWRLTLSTDAKLNSRPLLVIDIQFLSADPGNFDPLTVFGRPIPGDCFWRKQRRDKVDKKTVIRTLGANKLSNVYGQLKERLIGCLQK